ncbi:MAG: 30S ribosomal protein S16 [Candidatus Woesebacteria bacterium GW2011_GWB1_43_14]|uniref:Small ribosomal subunit protein bS16 n=1 Tax=Candidatus Woesebacteria bacterium GW2011_GWB1_43_14 TaxID=1618578 RepID=A0A0G1DGP6_9BACT|nr:MAG: 30S ribosomal protein S16, small subunit ribosomal protein S16 [Candidatus Woesebacteria bacterium GW2011_GWC1_42_9]KKS97050.1 MAG: 30S ribosomal protein S16 [Candidatus Woesebacteria bacterium GW2011_GWB1_43_14]
MVKIRLSRGGKRNDPSYRIIAIDSRKKRGGESLAVLGFWHPKSKLIKIDRKKIDEWAEKGAQISPAVIKLIGKK